MESMSRKYKAKLAVMGTFRASGAGREYPSWSCGGDWLASELSGEEAGELGDAYAVDPLSAPEPPALAAMLVGIGAETSRKPK